MRWNTADDNSKYEPFLYKSMHYLYIDIDIVKTFGSVSTWYGRLAHGVFIFSSFCSSEFSDFFCNQHVNIVHIVRVRGRGSQKPLFFFFFFKANFNPSNLSSYLLRSSRSWVGTPRCRDRCRSGQGSLASAFTELTLCWKSFFLI